MQRKNVLAGPYMDRAAHLRKDPAWFENALADEGSRSLPVWKSRSLIVEGEAPRAALLELSRIPEERRNLNELILLGRFDGIDIFTFEVESL